MEEIKNLSAEIRERAPAEFKKSFQVMFSFSDPDFDRKKYIDEYIMYK